MSSDRFDSCTSLVVPKIIGCNELEAAISAFEDNIRFEDKNLQRPSWLLSKMLRDYLNEAFDEKSYIRNALALPPDARSYSEVLGKITVITTKHRRLDSHCYHIRHKA